jgi:hypothetical protein
MPPESLTQLDLLAADRLAVLLHVGLDAILHLDAGIGELARQRHDQADLEGVLGAGRRDAGQQNGDDAAHCGGGKSHRYPPGNVHGVARSIGRPHAGVNLTCCHSLEWMR